MLFLGYLIDSCKQSATVKSYLSAIRAVLKDDGVKLNEDLFLVSSSLTRACKYKNDNFRTRLPLQKGMLTVLLQQVEQHFNDLNQQYLKILYRAVFSTMYFGLLQISEVACEHVILARDVHIGFNKKKLLFILRTSKMHWHGNRPQLVKISSTRKSTQKQKAYKVRQQNNNLLCPCPYQLLRDYATRRGPYRTDDEPFFVFADNSPITQKQLCVCFRKMLSQAGFQVELYRLHSFRTGRTCDLLKLGLSVESIKKIGRWRSNAVFKYLKYYAT